MGVADGDSERIALVGGTLDLAAEQHRDHLANLLFTGAAVSRDCLLHRSGCVFEDIQVLLRSSQQQHATHMPQLQGGAWVFRKEYGLHCHYVRAALFKNHPEPFVQEAQPTWEIITTRRADSAAALKAELVADLPHQSPACDESTGVDAEDS